MDHCAECGFSYDSVASSDVASTLQVLASAYIELLRGAEIAGIDRSRPTPAVWSALEYTCHVRDVLLIQRDRIILALVEDTPSFSRMYRDERVDLAGYRQESVDDVSNDLTVSVRLFGTVFGHLSSARLERDCIYNFPAATVRTVAWLGSHTIHEATHHLTDVRLVLDQVAS
jgi:hypothetical protein